MTSPLELVPPAGSGAARPLSIVGGHVALDFANTVDDPYRPTRHDHLGTFDGLLAWSCVAAHLSDDAAGRLRRAAARKRIDTAAVLRQAHDLREVIGDLFGAVADGSDGVSARWRRLRPFVASAVGTLGVDDTAGPARWTWAGPGAEALLLHPVAWAAAGLVVSPDLRRLKRCAGCPWLFLDGSRNHSRRWCAMGDCGTVEKTQRYVARRSAVRRAARSR